MSVADLTAGESAIWRLAARICPVTKLVVNRDSERLVQVNAVVGAVFFLVGAVAALLLALTRWQAVHLLPPNWYYRLLTLHGLDMLIFFIIFFIFLFFFMLFIFIFRFVVFTFLFIFFAFGFLVLVLVRSFLFGQSA